MRPPCCPPPSHSVNFARRHLGNHAYAATNTHATVEPLDAVSMRLVSCEVVSKGRRSLKAPRADRQ
jgi:hypothetical protein